MFIPGHNLLILSKDNHKDKTTGVVTLKIFIDVLRQNDK